MSDLCSGCRIDLDIAGLAVWNDLGRFCSGCDDNGMAYGGKSRNSSEGGPVSLYEALSSLYRSQGYKPILEERSYEDGTPEGAVQRNPWMVIMPSGRRRLVIGWYCAPVSAKAATPEAAA